MFQYVDTNIIICSTECTETVETPKYRRPDRGAIELMKCAHSQKYNYSGANSYLVSTFEIHLRVEKFEL